MQGILSRRRFLQRTATGSLLLAGPALYSGRGSPNEKLRVGFVGVANRAAANLAEIARETASVEVVALCDVDDGYLAAAKEKHPGAQVYTDYRRLIDQKGIDAVVVSTPDHTHAVACAAALRTNRHVYCEKPLTRTLSECRVIEELTRRHRRVTQLGTQIHAGDNYRRVVEWIQAGSSARCARFMSGLPPPTAEWNGPRIVRRSRRGLIGTCGWARSSRVRITRTMPRSNGATGGRSAAGRWRILAAISWICRTGRCSCGTRSRSSRWTVPRRTRNRRRPGPSCVISTRRARPARPRCRGRPSR